MLITNSIKSRASGGGGAVILRALSTEGSTITAKLGSEIVTGQAGADGVFQSDLPGLGVWEVTTETGEYSFTQNVKVFRYGITECWALASKPLRDCTWEEIDAIARSGQYKQIWKPGDAKEITLQNQEKATVILAGIDHDKRPDDTIIPLTFIMGNCFATVQKMQSVNSNYGGWGNSMLRNTTMASLSALFPEDLQKVVTTCLKKSSFGTDSPTIYTTNDAYWVPSEIEVFGAVKNSLPGEGEVYPIFTDAASRIRTVASVARAWWLRSAATGGYDTGYCDVEYNGVNSKINVTNELGVCLGFCVG